LRRAVIQDAQKIQFYNGETTRSLSGRSCLENEQVTDDNTSLTKLGGILLNMGKDGTLIDSLELYIN
jgi:hypothetical protein